MKEEVNNELLKDADELINRPGREIMALSLSKNERHADNYQMAMNIKLRNSITSLGQNIKNLKKSTDISSWIMIGLTLVILIFTIVSTIKLLIGK
jgi:hypothetical protein